MNGIQHIKTNPDMQFDIGVQKKITETASEYVTSLDACATKDFSKLNQVNRKCREKDRERKKVKSLSKPQHKMKLQTLL